LYFDCSMGAAGDMVTAALLDLMEDKQEFLEKMNLLFSGTITVSAKEDSKLGVRGTHVTVMIEGEEEKTDEEAPYEHHHHHTSLKEIYEKLDQLEISSKVRKDARAIYEIIAKAESTVHGMDMENIHFHEVGSLDAVADVVGACLLMEKLAPEAVKTSPIHVGSGTVKCAHGILPVPAPATKLILEGVPYYQENIQGELCTPTGAAILKYFTSEYGDRPEMESARCGVGTGTKDFPRPGVLRAYYGELKED